jgi:malonate-semialdehyde dehydrogenase (acetylating) / methylmalonate-semialdehyde dehydrogenase
MIQANGVLPEVEAHYGRCRNFVGGTWVESESERTLDVVNPATALAIASVPLSRASEVRDAVSAASLAFGEWRETPPQIRVQPLFRLKVLLEEHYDEIARIVTQEHGKIIDEARGSVRRTIDNIEFACGIPSLMMGESLEDGGAYGIDEEAIRQPLGVCACIAPFNFPAMVPFWFWPTALATGNTFVVKPSEQVPLTQQRIFDLVLEAEFPDGVLNLVNGDREAVDALLQDDRVRAVSFVGSTRNARYVYENAARFGKRVQCQGAAKNFLTVMPDAKLEVVIPNLVSSFFGNTGQRCLAGAVLVPVGDRADEVVEQFLAASRGLKLGYGLDPSVQLGPLAARKHFDRVMGYIETGVREGGKLLLDGRRPDVPGYSQGCFVGPTLFDDVTPDMTIAREEIFGPVVSIVRVRDLDEAIRLANGSAFGNASSIYTSSGRTAREYKYRVRSGNIGVNIGVPAPMAYFPFGGMNDSFFGDLHGQGRDGVSFFTDRKVVISRWV